jgi:hypothetical protein
MKIECLVIFPEAFEIQFQIKLAIYGSILTLRFANTNELEFFLIDGGLGQRLPTTLQKLQTFLKNIQDFNRGSKR